MIKRVLLLSIITGLCCGYSWASPFRGALDALSQRQDYEARRESSSEEDLKGNGDSRPIPPGETLTLLDTEGPGVLTHFWNTIAAFDPFAGRSVVVRIYYDGNEHPSVQAPLGDFFGVGHGALKSFTSLPVSTSSSGLSRNCYWQIPFKKHIKVTVTNESPIYPVADFYYYLDWQKHEELPEDTMYFHAKYDQSMPAEPGHYTILKTEGEGHYIGTVYSAHQVELGWFGEGDDFIYIDGAEVPQLKGTGTEDYFNDAWGFREFSTPYHGVSLFEGGHPGDRVTAYRWHVLDPIPFKESLHVTIEHRGRVWDETATDPEDFELVPSRERPDWVSSVGFWYQYPPVEIEEPLPPVDKRIAPYSIIPVQSLKYRAEPAEIVTPSYIGYSYITDKPEGYIEYDFEVEKSGRYNISAFIQDSPAGTFIQPYLNGEAIGLPIDMVAVSGGFKIIQLDLHDLDAGYHTLRFEKLPQRSPNTRSILPEFKIFTIEYLLLLRLEDMEGYREVYNQAKP